jgi:CRISPR/Cas system CMR subunit Cmr6 (Cas7 group RAMP superfamily)
LFSAQAEKLRQKEELRKEKEAARQKVANEKATARRIAREYMELMEDERLELMELVSRSKGLPSMLSLDSDTLQQLDSFRGAPYIPGSKFIDSSLPLVPLFSFQKKRKKHM